VKSVKSVSLFLSSFILVFTACTSSKDKSSETPQVSEVVVYPESDDVAYDYYLKLCGSGGGGYILGFTEDLERAKASLKDYKLEVVYQF